MRKHLAEWDAVAQRSYGGGISNTATLTVTDSLITGNIADSVGGGVYSTGVFHLVHSTISGNTSSSGGGVYEEGSDVAVDGSVIRDNQGGMARAAASPCAIATPK